MTIFKLLTGPCEPNPCKNGARCVPNGNSYDCMCAIRYTGPTCAGNYPFKVLYLGNCKEYQKMLIPGQVFIKALNYIPPNIYKQTVHFYVWKCKYKDEKMQPGVFNFRKREKMIRSDFKAPLFLP